MHHVLAQLGDYTAFSIHASTGILTALSSFDFNVRRNYNVTVFANDNAGHAINYTVRLQVTIVNDVRSTSARCFSLVQVRARVSA